MQYLLVKNQWGLKAIPVCSCGICGVGGRDMQQSAHPIAVLDTDGNPPMCSSHGHGAPQRNGAL